MSQDAKTMNGAESLVATLVAGGVTVSFTNPGTSEMHFVGALDTNPDMRCILGLFEGVVTGAADGYGRMADRPAATLLHLGPGLGNGIANLHNARRARTPIVNIVGDHATGHLALDAPLTSDIESLARPVSCWYRASRHAHDVARDGAEAVRAAMTAPGGVATLVLPADTAWNAAPGGAAGVLPVAAPASVQGGAVDDAARALRSGEATVLLLNGRALRSGALEQAGRIAAATGARLFSDTFCSRIERGAGRVATERLPYFGEQVLDVLAGVRHLVLVGTTPPVSFFAYPGKPGSLVPEGCAVHSLVGVGGDAEQALAALADAVGAGSAPAPLVAAAAPQAATGPGALDPFSLAQTVGALLPENAVIVDEAATGGFAVPMATAGAPPHDMLQLTGGAIGQGMPVAVGAAVACPDRKVVCLQADGSGMYTLQALWTMARENLDVTTVVFSNRKYAILQIELARVGVTSPGPKALSMFDLSNPELDWTALARGMGVEASRAVTADEFHAQLASAMAARGPRLIEAVLP